jgi:transketolase
MEQASMVEYFGRTLVELGESDPKLVVLDADVSASTKTVFFQERFPDRFIEVGISEQDLVGMASGLALLGKKAVAAAFSLFITGKAWEQIANSIARQNLDVMIVGTHSGLSPHADGESHQTFADITLMRVLPNMSVEVPADASATHQATKWLNNLNGPSYLRLARGLTPVVYANDYELTFGKIEEIKEGDDITIISNGIMVSASLEAAKELEKLGISSRVLDLHTIKPLDEGHLIKAINKTNAILTVEEHSIYGGLGGLVSEILSENKPTIIQRIGIRDRFGVSSRNYLTLLEEFGLSSTHIVNQARLLLEKIKR